MPSRKFDKNATASVISALNSASKEHGILLVRHAATKWANAQREKARLLQEQKDLESELADVQRRLSK